MRIVLALSAAMLAGCAGFDGRGLVPGRSSVDQVEALMGPSSDRRAGRNGETVRYYSRLPYGREMYAARFAPDGKLVAVEQRLSEEYVAKLAAGSSRADDVLDLLGPPYRRDQYPRMSREIWTYPMQGYPYPKELYAQFSADGVLREVLIYDDPQWRARDSHD